MKSLVKKIKEGWCPEIGRKIIVGHGDYLESVLQLKDMVRKELPNAEIEIAEIGAVIGSHTGPGILALLYWGNNR